MEQRGHGLKQFSGRLSKTANIVAFANSRSKHRSENLLQLSSQVQNLTPQLVNAGTIKMNYPENKAADENFENLRKQYAAGVQTIRDFCDEAIDIRTFLKQTSDHIQVYSRLITITGALSQSVCVCGHVPRTTCLLRAPVDSP